MLGPASDLDVSLIIAVIAGLIFVGVLPLWLVSSTGFLPPFPCLQPRLPHLHCWNPYLLSTILLPDAIECAFLLETVLWLALLCCCNKSLRWWQLCLSIAPLLNVRLKPFSLICSIPASIAFNRCQFGQAYLDPSLIPISFSKVLLHFHFGHGIFWFIFFDCSSHDMMRLSCRPFLVLLLLTSLFSNDTFEKDNASCIIAFWFFLKASSCFFLVWCMPTWIKNS